MAANTAPSYSRIGNISGVTMTAANTAKDGTGTVGTVFTADATEGSFLDYIKVRPMGTNVATVLRLFINNGGVNSTATNNFPFTELTIPASTNTETAANPEYVIPFRGRLPATFKILATLGTAVAGGIAITGVGGTY